MRHSPRLLYLSATGDMGAPRGVTKAERTILTPDKNDLDHVRTEELREELRAPYFDRKRIYLV